MQQPEASPSNPGCQHANVTVTEGNVYRFRLVSNALLALMSVCFEGHNVTIIAADATPTEPISFGECVDINSGQRHAHLLFRTRPYKVLACPCCSLKVACASDVASQAKAVSCCQVSGMYHVKRPVANLSRSNIYRYQEAGIIP